MIKGKYKIEPIFTDGTGNIIWNVNVPVSYIEKHLEELGFVKICEMDLLDGIQTYIREKYNIYEYEIKSISKPDSLNISQIEVTIHVPLENSHKLLSRCPVYMN